MITAEFEDRNLQSESKGEESKNLDNGRDQEEERQRKINEAIEKRISLFRKFIYRFRAPNIFESITFLF